MLTNFQSPQEFMDNARLASASDIDEAVQAYVRRFSAENDFSGGQGAIMHAEMAYFLGATEGVEWQEEESGL